ncbi:MAG: hypothetical protein MZV49_05925 [Rhodopseudomonas palustris]|nr:hypothetical protein [Rhodopseudomonas palustris]
MPFPPHGERAPAARRGRGHRRQVIRWRCEQLGALRRRPARHAGARRAVQPRRSRKHRHRRARWPGRWTSTTRPPARTSSLGAQGDHAARTAARRGPTRCGCRATTRARSTAWRELLSLDMRVIDPAWIGMKLRKLLNYAEPLGDFMAFVPGAASAASRPGRRRWPTWRA